MSSLPSVSIVVPNFNGAATLGQTLQCLIDQRYPDLQILVVDGGSSDNSRDIIERFASSIDWWVSEKDRGQSHAINKGLARCRGEVVNWLCSDDLLTPGALETVGRQFAADPGLDVLVGGSDVVTLGKAGPPWPMRPRDGDVRLMPCVNRIPQPSCFYRRKLLDRPGPLLEEFHYAMDFELWMYFVSRGAKWKCIDEVLSVIQEAPTTKTRSGGLKIVAEWEKVYRRYSREWIPLTFWNRRVRTPLILAKKRGDGSLRGRLAGLALGATDWALTPFYGYWRVRVMDWSIWHQEGSPVS